jgi:hypothetical protein
MPDPPLKKKRRRKRRRPMLRFTPDAWSKLLYLRDRGESEIGGFGISMLQDLLCVTEFRLIRQCATWGSVAFEDAAIADFFDEQVDRGLVPQQFARIWCHTHPGPCPFPSGKDEETFARCFGSADWALMFILAQGGATYARLRFSAGPGGEIELPVEVCYRYEFAGTDITAWNAEYLACVNVAPGKQLPPDVPLAGESIWSVEDFDWSVYEEERFVPTF